MPDNASTAPRPNPNEKLVKVFDTEQEAEAMLVQGLLDSAGIQSDLRAIDAPQDTLPIGGVMIQVREEDADEANKIIETYRQSPPLDDETAEISG